MIRLGSLFDGIGGFPLAAEKNGICPVWASEVERFPVEVTKYHFPQMRHMGDITKLKGENLPVVDIIAGGSPCQDLSVAGRREGLDGERSGLFLEQVRLVREMRRQEERRMGSGRRADQLVRPRYMVWENVPGAFSSGEPKGADFHTVLEEVCRIPEESVSLPRRRAGHGLLPGLLWEKDSLSLGGYWTLNFGESPRDAAESSLSQILEATVPEKYYLSPKACGGIIRRSGNRGKKLPEILDRALRLQAGLPEPLD